MTHRPRRPPALRTLFLALALLTGAAQPASAIRFNDPEDPEPPRTPTALPQSDYYLSAARVPANCRWRSGGDLLSCWLQARPAVALHIQWLVEPPPTGSAHWDHWPNDLWAAFVTEFDKAMDWYTACLVPSPGGGRKIGACASLNRFQSPLPKGVQSPTSSGIRVSETVARKVHLSWVANSLALEMTGAVPWSITTYSYAQLHRLLSFVHQIDYSLTPDPAHSGWYTYGEMSPANATAVVQFLRANDILANNPTDTIGGLIEWSNRLEHYFSTGGPEDWTEFWGPSAPPVPQAMVMYGSEYTGPLPGVVGLHHWTAGCHGTTWFFEKTLRAVNLPVEPAYTGECGHTTPHFMTIDRYLSHGDDPYTTLMDNDPPIPGWELFISASKFHSWFPEVDPGSEKCSRNVGRRAAQVAVEYLSDGLLDLYCADGTKHPRATSSVFAALQPYYTLKSLEQLHLWEGLAFKAQWYGLDCN